MIFRSPLRLAAAAALAFASSARAQSLLPPERVPLESLAAFRPGAANWRVAGGLAGDPRRDPALTPAAGTGLLVCNPAPAARENLFTTWEHGDLEVDFDFLLPPGADSGLYLQSRYEIQLRDCWGLRQPAATDGGGIYPSRDAATGPEGTGGAAPRANAWRAPGLWQHLHVEFQAPRFDPAGRKTANARFRKVVLNDFVIHENVEVSAPTRGAAATDERPLAPLMFQGSNLNGAVAIRAIACKRFDPAARVQVENLRYQFYSGLFKAVGDYDAARPDRAGVPAKFSLTAGEKSGKFALVFSGTMTVPADGDYAFRSETSSTVRLMIDGRTVLLPFEKSSEPGSIPLRAGAHAFRLDYLHNVGAGPKLDVLVEGPGLTERSIMENDPRPPLTPGALAKLQPIVVEPADQRVRLQRSFVPFEPRKRLYAINVGTPAGVHFSYDFETGAILRVWRGGFLDAADLWRGRAEDQVARPTGPALTFNAKPAVALIEHPLSGGWPDAPEALQASQGYTLEADDLPVFHSTLASLTIRDRIAPLPGGRGLSRTLVIGGQTADWTSWVLLAEADTITAQPQGGWIIGDRQWYLDWPANAAHTPVIHRRGGKQQLVVRIAKGDLDAPLHYELVW